MREILFRGKRLDNGEWIEGDSLHQTGDSVAIGRRDRINMPHIDTGTLSQYTGLTDNNGKRIFEGDIVKITRSEYDKLIIAEVQYSHRGLYYYNKTGLRLSEASYRWKTEVIGNKWDNPELLEVVRDE